LLQADAALRLAASRRLLAVILAVDCNRRRRCRRRHPADDGSWQQHFALFSLRHRFHLNRIKDNLLFGFRLPSDVAMLLSMSV